MRRALYVCDQSAGCEDDDNRHHGSECRRLTTDFIFHGFLFSMGSVARTARLDALVVRHYMVASHL